MISGVVDLIGNGRLASQLDGSGAETRLSDRSCLAENHDTTECHDARGSLDKDGGREKERIFEEAKAALGPALPPYCA